jgi:hypothetical protein
MVGLPTCQIVECDELSSGIWRWKCPKDRTVPIAQMALFRRWWSLLLVQGSKWINLRRLQLLKVFNLIAVLICLLRPLGRSSSLKSLLAIDAISSVWMSNVVVYWPGERRKTRTFLQNTVFHCSVRFYLLCTKRLRNRTHVISPTRPSLSFACNIEEVGVAWGRGYANTAAKSTVSILCRSK